MSTTIYLPTSFAALPSTERAASPPSLSGLRLAVLDNGKPNAGFVMATAGEALAAATGATLALVTKKGPGGRSANAAIPCAADIMERLIAEADLVITGSADCGSCTAYSVYDAIELERQGKPAVVVTTTKFRPIAETMSANFGLTTTRLLVLPHPLGGTDRTTLHSWADAAAEPLAALFSGAVDVATVDVATVDTSSTLPRDGDDLRIGALSELRTIVQADGSDLDVVAYDAVEGTLSLRLRIEDASCAECVMPVEHLQQVANDLLRPTMPGLRQVVIDDPRVN